MQTLEDPVTGAIKAEEQQIVKTLNTFNSHINDEVDRINKFQETLLEQLSKADAAIAQLENQATYFKALFDTDDQNNN